MPHFSRNGSGRYRSRARYLARALGTMALGLLVHLRGAALGPAARDILGDALWAAMVFWLAGALAPRASISRRAAASLAFCFAIEWSQLWHAPWVDALRPTTFGHLVLGSGFNPRDLAAYSAGVLAVWLLEWNAARRRQVAR